ncbi:MAG TPA: ABC transporter permease [Anaerolineaceae bacterium]|jgi:peptide/nickel transport system permease protein|nr:ABC transporter permease [Anaerolineaceae bacterium]HOR84674.1 ABC transporter permease [Anaerolineaceae bacterium]HPL43515.1 ABC transporter permease [Anaerolineaceae bacterium]HPY33648.1 ABC transporter permease [Anaerolineaceae bacterium]HQC21927.1 ABC transporter permease [Anaerolineaceae bacterium]
MIDNNEINENTEPEKNHLEDPNEPMALDDARRVKVLSPGMLVFKRFIRNKLAVIGIVILTFMFLFSFVGPLFSPYDQAQVFKGIGSMTKEFAGATYNTELRYTAAEGFQFSAADRTQFLLALGKKQTTFNSGGVNFTYVQEDPNTYRIFRLNPIAEGLAGSIRSTTGTPLSQSVLDGYAKAVEDKVDEFTADGVLYQIVKSGKVTQITQEMEVALGTLNVFDAYNQADQAFVNSYAFKLAASNAIADKKKYFSLNSQRFSVIYDEGHQTIFDKDGKEFAEVSNIIVNPLDQSLFLSVPFKKVIREAITNRENGFSYTENGVTIDYDIVRVNVTYNIKRETPTELIRMYERPTAEHPLGLDNNGMDLMTRLMYGGRVSLMVGFVVIFIEVLIGVLVGGISGYFGGWVDTGLMRFVDLFNSIPFYPMVLIFGSVMDALEVPPMTRIFLLMAILGLLGWTGVARVVRGQILSLREQDFMVATEATGIRTSRRIFRHLVPNVMPLLIVHATAGLGGIIISEATLGFLGLGVKYPLASWGSIINVASDAFVMTNYWFMWIPAGLLILLTVLGFNFVGDGLRDAFDPKMKR